MKPLITLPPITEQEEKEIREFVEAIISVDYETFRKIKDEGWFKGYWRMIMQFFRLPKGDLHKKYMDWCRPVQEEREKAEAWKILWKMDWMKSKMKNDYNLDQDVKYQIIKRSQIRHKFWWADEYLTIWIPYFDNQERKIRYYWTINVYESKTPSLFHSFIEKMRRYSWDTDIYLN